MFRFFAYLTQMYTCILKQPGYKHTTLNKHIFNICVSFDRKVPLIFMTVLNVKTYKYFAGGHTE